MKRIILSRTDNIGDVILSFPTAGFLKQCLKEVEIIFIGKNYTKELVEFNKNIHQFLNYSELETRSVTEIANVLRELNVDAIVHLYPNKKLALAAKQAGIKLRVGTGHRTFHLLTCNKKVWFSRKKSDLHEAQLNFRLLGPIVGKKIVPQLSSIPKWYGIKPPEQNFPELSAKFNIIFHTKSFGSAVDWELNNYIELASILKELPIHIYFTGTEKESELITPYIQELVQAGIASDVTGKYNLKEFISFINQADALVACSTGPLHIASSLGKLTLGLYSSRRPIHPGRWAPVGEKAQTLTAQDAEDKVPNINRVTPQQVANEIKKWINL